LIIRVRVGVDLSPQCEHGRQEGAWRRMASDE
jgi:hypothetical protein